MDHCTPHFVGKQHDNLVEREVHPYHTPLKLLQQAHPRLAVPEQLTRPLEMT